MRRALPQNLSSLLAACAVGLFVLLGGTWVSRSLADSLDDDLSARSPAVTASAGQLEIGQRIFYRKCAKCHVSGREGAPKIGQPGEWARRLQQPLHVLIDHAINGHQGLRGRMPPKGDFQALTDAEVTAAVHYIVQRGEWLASRYERSQVACATGPDDRRCAAQRPGDAALLQLLLLLRDAR